MSSVISMFHNVGCAMFSLRRLHTLRQDYTFSVVMTMARAQSYAIRQLNTMEPYYFTLVALASKPTGLVRVLLPIPVQPLQSCCQPTLPSSCLPSDQTWGKIVERGQLGVGGGCGGVRVWVWQGSEGEEKWMCGSVSVRCGVCHMREMHQCVAYGKRVLYMHQKSLQSHSHRISQLVQDQCVYNKLVCLQ